MRSGRNVATIEPSECRCPEPDKEIPKWKEYWMSGHDAHECDGHEHHGDEPGHVHDSHECDDHEHHADEHEHHAHECDTHEHHGDEPGHVHDSHECDGHEHHGH